MDKVIVYGLGKNYVNYKELIETSYEVVGYYDRDQDKIPNEKAVTLMGLLEMEYDYILVTTLVTEIIDRLLEIGIEKNKIKIFPYMDSARNVWRLVPLKGITYSGSFEDIIILNLCKEINISPSDMKYIELGASCIL